MYKYIRKILYLQRFIKNFPPIFQIAGLSELPVQRGEEMVQLLINGSAARATGSTAMNSTSSRSHAIFSIIIEQKDKTGDG